MDMSRALPSQSKHLKADDMGPQFRANVTIDRIEMEAFADQRKPVMYFSGKDKGLVLNKTNVQALVDLFGTAESDDWIGQRIELFTAKVDYQGKRVLGLRVGPTRTAAAASTKSAPPPRVPHATVEPLEADDIPF